MMPGQKATRTHTREHNKRLVLKTIYEHEAISRAGVARETRLTPPSVSSLVAELIEEGLVDEVGQKPSQGGKPATLLGVVANSRHLIGMDLANSEFRGAVVNLRGDILHQISEPVCERDGEAALGLVYEMLDTLVAETTSPLLGIGIGTPGLMDSEHGIVRTAVNLDWRDLPLVSLLSKRYRVPAYIVNDSQAAALAEYTFGDARGTDNLVVLKVGRGIGAGIIINGSLFYGDGYGAGEIGHFKVIENGLPCRCGHDGCLETVSSTRAIIQQARTSALNSSHPALHHLTASPNGITTETLLTSLSDGYEVLSPLIARAGAYLGVAVAGLVSALNIHHIIIAGSAARFGETLLDPLRQEMAGRSLALLSAQTTVTASQLGTEIVILGAAALLLANELSLMG